MPLQTERIFFGQYDPYKSVPPTDEEKREHLEEVFSDFIGNEKAVRKIVTAAYTALGRYNHMMRELSFAIFGPASAGKTTLARLYSRAVDLPLCEISPKAVKSVEDVLREISNVLTHEELPLVEEKANQYRLPPMVIFIDEVHALPDSIIQGLLKATEYNDAMMVTEKGRYVNTHNVTWMIATTDEGKLFDAFRTRFSPVNLQYLSKREIAQVVHIANPDLTTEVCALVAHYNSRITRKALEFCRYMRMSKAMNPDQSWEDIARLVAMDEGIDEYGMHDVHLRILRALGQAPVARNRISIVVGRKDEEVERFIMPWLLCETEDQPAYVTVTTKGYTITEAGLFELEKRNVPHNGAKAQVA